MRQMRGLPTVMVFNNMLPFEKTIGPAGSGHFRCTSQVQDNGRRFDRKMFCFENIGGKCNVCKNVERSSKDREAHNRQAEFTQTCTELSVVLKVRPQTLCQCFRALPDVGAVGTRRPAPESKVRLKAHRSVRQLRITDEEPSGLTWEEGRKKWRSVRKIAPLLFLLRFQKKEQILRNPATSRKAAQEQFSVWHNVSWQCNAFDAKSFF